jgi:NADPH-dependent curcumin reductase CurA
MTLMKTNRRLVLARRPDSLPDASTFRRDDGAIPEPREGEFLVRNVFLPVDPGMRPVLSDVRIGADEFEPLALGALVGYLTVGQVVQSRDPAFAPGDWVTDILFWQDYAVTTALTARKFDPQELSPTTWLGILGVPGLSAWTGLITLAAPQPKETLVVTSAAGAVGSLAGQIGRNLGCRVVGVAGGAAKCRFVKDELGFDEVIDYRSVTDIGAAVRHACPQGVDILFDNVGNAMVDAMLPVMRRGGRITLCGQIADYHLPPAARPGIKNTNRFITHRLSMRGLFVYDHAAQFPQALGQMTQWMREKKLILSETIVPGFDQLPAAFARLFTGETMGRTIVRIDGD